ncbi:hypothetical protein SeMB42_g04299 [Synchytrium endobioticum]|uniref:Uncharacterized protein n=1 Tax=Synchytrium endobioticum TaxID=286115 RepID=A0A507CZG1_9FUNG|nr:hypothetical protein SeMB42_g04299 [Synchytrium endobioticum]
MQQTIEPLRSRSGSPATTASPDQLDLKKNNDYQLVASALAVLRHQLSQAQKDLQRLEELKTEALSDPLTYVDKLTTRCAHMDYTGLQKVIAIPHINIEKYLEPLKKGGVDIAEIVIPPPKRPKIHKMPASEISTSIVVPFQRSPSSSSLCASPFQSPAAAAGDISNLNNAASATSSSPHPQTPILVKPAPKAAARRGKGTRGPGIRPAGLYYSNRFSGASYLGTPTVRMETDDDVKTAAVNANATTTATTSTPQAPLSPSPSV